MSFHISRSSQSLQLFRREASTLSYNLPPKSLCGQHHRQSHALAAAHRWDVTTVPWGYQHPPVGWATLGMLMMPSSLICTGLFLPMFRISQQGLSFSQGTTLKWFKGHMLDTSHTGHKPHLGHPCVTPCSDSRRPQEFNNFIIVPTSTSRGCTDM